MLSVFQSVLLDIMIRNYYYYYFVHLLLLTLDLLYCCFLLMYFINNGTELSLQSSADCGIE